MTVEEDWPPRVVRIVKDEAGTWWKQYDNGDLRGFTSPRGARAPPGQGGA